ncbi:hypothetical protein FZEAL_3172 [Fusarium zealandicum]|uniref:CENP-C homolog n=1 Tax=Fusarium zealandicum TaxID=1053134 RepID=A0A8H4UQ21_9HYPO|nr:hypothetical protein FZEAL_3172 [Fusarium zealandicum]
MAPVRGSRRSEAAEPQGLYQFGVRGRKTGVELKDTGARDSYGMQPLDEILSSPEHAPSGADERSDDDNDQYDDGDDDDEGSVDMEIETSAGPGPRTLLKERGLQYPIPRSRSPVKTNLLSSPRRNPNLEHLSSPTRRQEGGAREPTVTRRLDFGHKAKGRAKPHTNGANGTLSEEDDADETEDAPEPDQESDAVDDMELLGGALSMVEDMHRSSASPESEREPPPPKQRAPAVKQPAAAKKPRGRPPKAKPVEQAPPEELSIEEEEEEEEEDQDDDEPVLPSPRKAKKAAAASKPKPPEPAPPTRKSKAQKRPAEDEEPDNDATEPEDEARSPQTKKPRTAAPKPSKPAKPAPAKEAPTTEAKTRGRPGRKPKAPATGDAEASAGESSFMALQRGPPMPKSRGLVSVRRDADEVRTTRSGRHSYRPLDWWRGDRVVQEEEEFDDVSGRNRFVLSTIKEVIRAPQEEAPTKTTAKSKGRSKTKPKRSQEDDVDFEEWEINPGTVNGEVILWEPEHELQPPGDDEPVEVMEDRVAISADAIQTREIRDATFRFAKTLTTPFLGAGIVDLPPGSEKRPKNSRKMHMVFFVHTGKVLVTVNEASFRINAGGMWFVPRGNYYSITNDYETPSRIFFSQGCEISAPTEMDQSQSMMA